MTSETANPLSIVAVGAHMDDCWLGMGGTALKALRKGHQVTMVTAVTDYEWLPYLAGRDAEIKPILQDLYDRTGIKQVSLKHGYMRLENNPALVDEMSQVMFDLRPDILFCHAEDEDNQDHTALGAACRIAALHGECFVKPSRGDFKYTFEIYQYTTGWQARRFAPDTFVDVSDVMAEALELCNTFDDLYAGGAAQRQLTVTDHPRGNRTFSLNGHARFKFAQSIAYGGGSAYAEGFQAYTRLPLEYRRLARV